MIPLPTVDALDAISIPVACPVPWDSMRGDHRTRFCGECKQNVHDVSELTRAEAVALVSAGGKLPCLQIYCRPDGRVMTADCTTNRERVWKWLRRRSPWLAAAFALVFLAGCGKPPVTYIKGGPEGPIRPSPDAVQSVVGGTAAAEKEAEAEKER